MPLPSLLAWARGPFKPPPAIPEQYAQQPTVYPLGASPIDGPEADALRIGHPFDVYQRPVPPTVDPADVRRVPSEWGSAQVYRQTSHAHPDAPPLGPGEHMHSVSEHTTRGVSWDYSRAQRGTFACCSPVCAVVYAAVDPVPDDVWRAREAAARSKKRKPRAAKCARCAACPDCGGKGTT